MGSPPPRGATWGASVGEHTFADLARALRSGPGRGRLRFASWNVRWMTSPHTPQSSSKRAARRRWLGYLADPWNVLDAAIIVLCWLSYIPGLAGGSVSSRGFFRVVRCLRPLRWLTAALLFAAALIVCAIAVPPARPGNDRACGPNRMGSHWSAEA